MLINLLQAEIDELGGGYGRLIRLIGRTHASEGQKKRHRRRAAQLFRALRHAGIVDVTHPDNGPAKILVRQGLQDDFSMNHTLSLYVVQTLDLLDSESETHSLDVLTLVEAVLEDPRVILYRQLDKIKGELIGRLKAEGVEYEERMAELEKVEHPKPNAEFLEETFIAFAETHPWVGGEDIHPKSIAREMFEICYSFNDYVQVYGLARSEGVLLRYLTQVYKAMVQTIPEDYWTEELIDIMAYLYGLVTRTDSSLIEEWKLLVAGPDLEEREEVEEVAGRSEQPWDIAADQRAFRARVRNELHTLLKALANGDYDSAIDLFRPSDDRDWTPEALEEAMDPFWEERGSIDLTPRARQAHNTVLREESTNYWTAQQKIIDADGDDDWVVDCVIDLNKERAPDEPLISLRHLGT